MNTSIAVRRMQRHGLADQAVCLPNGVWSCCKSASIAGAAVKTVRQWVLVKATSPVIVTSADIAYTSSDGDDAIAGCLWSEIGDNFNVTISNNIFYQNRAGGAAGGVELCQQFWHEYRAFRHKQSVLWVCLQRGHVRRPRSMHHLCPVTKSHDDGP